MGVDCQDAPGADFGQFDGLHPGPATNIQEARPGRQAGKKRKGPAGGEIITWPLAGMSRCSSKKISIATRLPYPARVNALAISSAIILRLLFSTKKAGPACR